MPVGLVGVGVGVLDGSVEEGVGVGVLEEGVGVGVLDEGMGVVELDEGVGVDVIVIEEDVGVGVLDEGVGVSVLDEGVGVGVSMSDEKDVDETIDEELSLEDADDTMALIEDNAVDEELDETVEVAGARVSIAKPRHDERSSVREHFRPTIDVATVACAVVRALEIAMTRTLTTHVAGSYTLSVVCTCFGAALEAIRVEVGEIATVIIGTALQGKSTAISTRVRATVVLGAGVACWTARGTSGVAWRGVARRGSRLSGNDRCADHVCTGDVSI